MLSVGQFYDDLRHDLARGTALDQRLPTWSRQALKLLERNHSFSYMKDTYVMVPLPEVRSFALEMPRLKTIDELGYWGTDQGSAPLKKIGRREVRGRGSDLPARYWLEQGVVHFEGLHTEVYPMVLRVTQFSEWPTDQNDSHPMLEFAEDLLKYEVLVSAASTGVKQSSLPFWSAKRDEALRAALNADEALDFDTESVMEYRGGPDGDLYPRGSEALMTLEGFKQLPGVSGLAGLYHLG